MSSITARPSTLLSTRVRGCLLCGVLSACTVAPPTDDAGPPDAGPKVTDDASVEGREDASDADATMDEGGGISDGYDWQLPMGFPEPLVPADNPMSEAKVELGRHLFYDTRLSANETQSCASCHQQDLAFTDGRAVGLGSTGESHSRGAMSLANVVYTTTMTWSNPEVTSLEEQALAPLFGTEPVELGLADMEDELIDRIRAEPTYEPLFAEAFPDDDDPIRLDSITKAIAAFERALLSGDSPFDRYQRGDVDAISESARRGNQFFFGEDGECHHCHGTFVFSDALMHVGALPVIDFHNTGLYNLDGMGSYPAPNEGLFKFTGDPHDMGAFKAPSLRNIAVTAPYMHDGSIATLEEVVEHYAAGGRTIEDGPYAGMGSQNRYRSGLVAGFQLTDRRKADLVAFLESLTDESFLTDPRFSDPWPRD